MEILQLQQTGWKRMSKIDWTRTHIDDRFHLQCRLNEKTGCWDWIGTISATGYGQIKDNYKTITAHRMSWLLHKGPIVGGLFVCHKCDNRGKRWAARCAHGHPPGLLRRQWVSHQRQEGRAVTNNELAKRLARKMFECPTCAEPTDVLRIAFKGNGMRKGEERDFGGLCEAALVDVIEAGLQEQGHDRK
jgi:hypothetical protein